MNSLSGAKLGLAALLGLGAFAASVTSEAHFTLDAPAATLEQDSLGNPQKAPPCGGDGTATGDVTVYQSGQNITITINETIYHPGHYRVALALNDLSELPAEPPVTAGTTACGSVPIMDPPVFPVLADGVLLHSSPFGGPQSFEVTLPDGVTCENCTLQIIEFMSEHGLNNPGGCFYHHCANITIQDEPVVTTNAGGGGDGGSSAAAPNGAGGEGASTNNASGGNGNGGSGGSGGSSASDDGEDGCSASPVPSTPFGLSLSAGLVGLAVAAASYRRARPRSSNRG